MQLVGLQILVISTSIIAWIVICISWMILLPRFVKERSTSTFSVPILFTVWGMTTYALYETFFLCQGVCILSGFSCWSFTLLIPLVYMYYRFRITGRIPDTRCWIRHLLIPGILAASYLGMISINGTSGLQINGWSEFANSFPTRWSIFSITCLLAGIIQASVYTFRLQKIKKAYQKEAILSHKEAIFVLCFWAIIIINALAPNNVFNILYNLSITALGGYIIWKIRLSSMVMSRLIFDLPKLTQTIPPTRKTKRMLIPTEKQKKKIAFWLSPETCKLKVNLKMIADDVMIERGDLSIYIRRLVGVRYNVYANAVRLHYAEELLLDENLKGITITELIERTGFQSNSTFYRAFTNRHRKSPLEWKKQVLENKENKSIS